MNKAVNNRGSILLTTLWIMAILSVLAMGIGFRASLEVRLSGYSMNKLQARYLAKAGIVKARKYLENDTKKHDTLYECGILLKEEESPENVFGGEYNKLGSGEFSVYYTGEKEAGEEEEAEEERSTTKKYYGMIDEERKININMSKLAPDNRAEYRRIMRALLPEPEEDFTKEEIIDGILDWQDKDSFGSAEEPYYHGLEFPYKCKNTDFEFIEELFMVRGMTPAIFNEIKDYITVYGEGKINVNTASKKVLDAVIGDVNIVDDFILKARKGADEISGTEDDKQFTLFMLIPKTKKDYFISKSEHYMIKSYGNVRGRKTLITAVVKKKTKKDEKDFVYYHEE